jgi:endo-1,4-beta-mannosidase
MRSDMIRTELEHHRQSTDTQKLPALITVVAFFWAGLAVSIVQQPIHADPLQAIAGPAQSRLSAVRLDGNYFSHDGHRFIPVGANWIPASTAMQWPTQWNPKAIEADFARMRELGFNTIRLDFLWAWIEPRPGDYNPEAFREIDFLVSLAHRYHIYLHPSLLIGGEVGEAYWDLPYRQGRHPHSDPDMLRIQTDHVAELAQRYGKEPAILAWDLTDEPPFWIVADSTTDSMAINWTRLLSWSIRRYDLLHPIVVGTSMEDVGHGPFRPDNILHEVDFFSVHPYSIYAHKLFPDAMLSERGTYGSAFQTALSGSAGRPVMVQEIGASSAQYDPDQVAKFLRASLYSGLGAGANGFLIWCYTDTAPEQFHKVPYLRSPHETQFGLTTWEGKQRASATMLAEFEKIIAGLDLTGIEPAPAEAGIIVPNEWSKARGDFSHYGLTGPEVVPYTSTDEGANVAGQSQPSFSEENSWLTGSWLSSYVLARRAGMKADFPREYQDWQKRPLILLPSPLTSTDSFLVHVHSDFWEKAQAYVSGGGALYASLAADAAIPGMEALFGVRLVDANPIDQVTLRVVTPFGGLKVGETLHYSVPTRSPRSWGAILSLKGGTVIAVDQDGRPALVANTVGSGRTLLSAYPLENYIAGEPAAFEKSEGTHHIYQAFREWSGIKPLFHSDQPSVEVCALRRKTGGYAVVTNHSGASQHVMVTASAPLHSITRITPQEPTQIDVDGSTFRVDMEAYEGAVFEWK